MRFLLLATLAFATACVADDPLLTSASGGASDAGASVPEPDAGAKPPTDAGSAEQADAAEGDAATPKTCTPEMAFTTVKPVPGAAVTSTVLEESPRLSKDELRLYFTRRSFPSDNDGTTYVATRGSRDADFGNVMALNELQANVGTSNGGTSGAAFTADALRVVFASARTANYSDDLFVATRANAGVGFATPVAPLDSVNLPNVNDTTPFVVGSDLYFASDRQGAGLTDLYVAGWNGATYATASAVAGINTSATEYAPVLNDAETVMYFASDRGGAGALGHADIFVVTRASSTDAWGAPVRLPSASSTGSDAPGWISDDGCRLYLWADRDGTNDVNLWVAER